MRFKFSAAACLVLAVTGCGGGGDDGAPAGGGGLNLGSGQAADDRSISLANASGNFDVSSSESAAKVGAVAFSGVGASASAGSGDPGSGAAAAGMSFRGKTGARGGKLSPTEAQACANGGTADFTSGTNPQTGQTVSRAEFNDCREGNTLLDGVFASACFFDPETFQCNPVTVTYGEGAESLLTEILAPEEERLRILTLGTIDSEITMAEDQTLERVASEMRLAGALIRVGEAGQPRANYELGNAQTVFHSDFEDVSTAEAEKFALDFGGPFRAASPCGSGAGTISTLVPIIFNADTGQTEQGQFRVDSGAAFATYTFNNNGTVTVATSSGQSQTYTPEQLEALCSF